MEVFVEKDPKTIIMTMSMTHYDNEENQTSHQQGGLINVAACVKSATKRVEKMIAKKILIQAPTVQILMTQSTKDPMTQANTKGKKILAIRFSFQRSHTSN